MASAYTEESIGQAFDKLRDFIAVNGDKGEKQRVQSLIVLAEYLGLERGDQESLLDNLTVVLGGANADSMYVSGAYVGFLFCLLTLDYEEADRSRS